MCERSTRTYRVAKRTVGEARRFGEAAVVSAVDPSGWDTADDVGLVISELISDVCESSATTVTVTVEIHRDRVEIAVTDDRVPDPRQSDDDRLRHEMTGRILDALTSERRVERSGDTVTTHALIALANVEPRITCP